MPLPVDADQVVFFGWWWDETTGGGVRKPDNTPATVILDPIPTGGVTASTTPNVRDLSAGGRIKTRPRVATVDAETGYYAVFALASNDPDLDAYGGRRVTFFGEAPFDVEVPWNAPLVTVDTQMRAAIPSLVVGSQVRGLRLEDAAQLTTPTPTPSINYLTSTQTLATVEEGVDAHDEDPQAHPDLRELIGGGATGGAGGVLSGTYPNPGFAVDMATQAELNVVSGSIPEAARDALGAALVAGANVTVTPDDTANTITISATVPASYSDEQAQDAFAALIAAGTHSGVSFAYNDAGNAISATVAAQSWSQITGKPTFATIATSGSAGDLSETASAKVLTSTERTKLAGVAGGATANSTDAQLRDRSTHTGTAPATSISDFTEAVQDAVAALLGAGSNITLNYDDAGNTLTVTAADGGSGGLDAEAVRDTIGVALVGAGNIAVTVNDALDTITITTTATANSSDASLRDRATHTGAQAISTVTGLQTALDAKAVSADLADVATSGAYSDLDGLPAIPSVAGLASTSYVDAADQALDARVDAVEARPAVNSPDDIDAAPAVHTHDVGDLDATGTPSATTYLRGDGAWAIPAGGGGDSHPASWVYASAHGFLPAASAAANDTALAAAVTAARTAKLPLWLGVGEFHISATWDCRNLSGLTVHGAGIDDTVIVQDTDTVDVWRVGGFLQRFRGFRVKHASDNPTGTTGDGLVFHKAAYSTFEQVEVDNARRLIAIAQENVNDPGTGSGTGNWMFTCTFRDVTVNRYAESGLYLRSYTGRSTGSIWDNIYVQNKNPDGSLRTATGNPVDLFLLDEGVFNQLNIEDAQDMGTGLLHNSGGWVVINSLHFERAHLGVFNGQYVRTYGGAGLIVNGLTLAYCDVANSSSSGASRIATTEAGGRLDIRGINLNTCSKTRSAARFTAVEIGDTDAANSVELTYAISSGSSPAFDALSDSTANPGLKRIGDTLYAVTPSSGGSSPAVQTTRIRKNTRQPSGTTTLGNGTDTQLTFETVDFRRGTAVGTGTANALVATVAGVYQVALELWLRDGGSGERSAAVRVNGTAIREYGSTAAGRLSGSGTMLLAANDVVTVTLYVGTTAIFVDGQSAKDSGLTLTYLGPAAAAV